MGKGSGSYGGGVKYMRAMDAGSLAELSQYMNRTYGMEMDRTLSRIDFDVARNLSDAVEGMLAEFPGIGGADLRLTATLKGNNAYAGTTVEGVIMLHPGIFSSEGNAVAAYREDLDAGFHPRGTAYQSIIVHEMGHQIEAAILRKRYPGTDRKAQQARSAAWRQGTAASELVSRALDRVAPGWQQNRKLAADQVARISKYATSDVSETVAEAISDYYSNRRNASPLSKEIWRLAKRELG